MPYTNMQKGITAIQQGNLQEGGRLLRIAMKHEDLKGDLRATALTWLAETKFSREEKLACYQEALQNDPNNENARRRMAALLEQSLPPMPTPPVEALPERPKAPAPSGLGGGSAVQPGAPPKPNTVPTGQETPLYGMPAAPVPARRTVQPAQPATSTFYRAVGVIDGPNGPGTAFFITREGLLATTRLVVGGLEHVTIELAPERRIPGQVTRAYPEFDLAFIETGVQLSQLLPMTPRPLLTESAPLSAIDYTGRVTAGQRRATKEAARPDWFPTTITQLTDVGGSPIFDQQHFLVGMLTRNTNRVSAHVYGLHIATIFRCLEGYLQEINEAQQRVYCPACGHLSRAGTVGGHYCEMCGSVLPASAGIPRFPVPKPQVDVLYGENIHRPCKSCGSRVGYYNGHCLRCAAELK